MDRRPLGRLRIGTCKELIQWGLKITPRGSARKWLGISKKSLFGKSKRGCMWSMLRPLLSFDVCSLLSNLSTIISLIGHAKSIRKLRPSPSWKERSICLYTIVTSTGTSLPPSWTSRGRRCSRCPKRTCFETTPNAAAGNAESTTSRPCTPVPRTIFRWRKQTPMLTISLHSYLEGCRVSLHKWSFE